MPDHYEKFRKQVKVEIIQVERLHVRVKGEKKKKRLRLWIAPPKCALMEKICMESFTILKCGCMRFVVVGLVR